MLDKSGNKDIIIHRDHARGELAEWSKAHDWKSCVG